MAKKKPTSKKAQSKSSAGKSKPGKSEAKTGGKTRPARGNKKKPANSGKSKSAPAKKTKVDPRQRLQRVMASAGIASRRECEIIIEEGRVEVDGQVVTKLGVKVDPFEQEIYVDAQKLVIQRLQYFMLNKPPGIVSTSKDPSGRPRVIDLISTDKRVYNVGRLDKASEGLILVTNDGELANRLTHPRYGIEKKYQVQVAGIPAPRELKKLEGGVYLADGVARAAKVKFLKRAKNGCWLEMILNEGRNREIRRMLALIGHKVRTLKRVAIGPLRLGDLPSGAHRPLTTQELRSLQNATAVEIKPRRRRPKRKRVGEKKSDDKKGARKESSSKRSGSKSSSRSSSKGRSPFSDSGKPSRKAKGRGASSSRASSRGKSAGKSSGRPASKKKRSPRR
jgi:23S rRNA pseudouridine2605 synthase